jgi:acylphosphatase
LPDGTVEVLACGRTDALDKLGAWLQEGPRMASVTKVEKVNEPYRDVAGFSTA